MHCLRVGPYSEICGLRLKKYSDLRHSFLLLINTCRASQPEMIYTVYKPQHQKIANASNVNKVQDKNTKYCYSNRLEI